MKMSESIGELATALCLFQREVKDAHKDSQAYNYKYADLGTVLALIRPLMGNCGLSLAQFPIGGAGCVGVESILMHTSGEWLSQELMMPVDASKNMSGAQQAGSVITYARRYSAAAILGITQVDDDAVKPQQPARVGPESQAEQTTKPKPATDGDYARITDYTTARQIPPKTLEWLKAGSHLENLTHSQATKIIKVCKDYNKEIDDLEELIKSFDVTQERLDKRLDKVQDGMIAAIAVFLLLLAFLFSL